MPISKSVVCPVLIGRSAVIDSLDQLMFQTSGDGDSSNVVLVSGEAGVGKSRLAAEMKARVMEKGWGILQGNCFETDNALPYAPLLDVLRTFCAAYSGKEIAGAFEPVAPELVKLLPELNRFFPEMTPSPLLEPESEKRRLFHALARFLVQLTEDQPRLIVIEDLHWSDSTSFEFVLFFARQLSMQRRQSALLITYRSDEALQNLAHFLAELDREHLAVEFVLPRLARSEVEMMLRTIFNQARPVKAEFLNAIYTLTEGNPFFIEEVLKSLMVAGEIFYVESEESWDRKPINELHIPRSVQDALHRRSRQLSSAAQKVLTLAAVAGRRFDFVLLHQLARPSDSNALEESELLDLIRELINAQLIVEEAADHFSFRHALTRQAIYTQLLARERISLHLQVAQILERMYANTAWLDAHVEELAYHFYEAALWDKAMKYSRRAGEKAQGLYASQQAVEQFSRALEAAKQASLEPSLNLLQARGHAYENLDDFDHAKADYQAVLDGAQSDGNRHLVWQALIALGALWSGRDFVRGGEYYQRAQEIARDLEDSSTLAHTLNRIGNWHLNMGRPFEALRYHEQALHNFETLKDKRGRAQTLDLLGITYYVCGDLVRGTACYEESLALFRELNDRQGMINSMTYLAVRSRFTTEVLDVPSLAQLISPGETALQMTRDMGWRSAETAVASCLAQCYSSLGDYGRALELGQSALRIAKEIQHREWISGACWALGHIYHELFALPEAQEQLELALAMARDASSILFFQDVTASLALTFIAQKNLRQAETVLNAVLDPANPEDTWGQRLCKCAKAELVLAQGDPHHAIQIIDGLVSTAANIETYGQHAIPRLSFLRGQALIALGKLSDAELEFRAAQDVISAQGMRPLLWRVHLTLGTLYLEQQRHEDAEQDFSLARSIVDQLAKTILDDNLRINFISHAMSLIPVAPNLSSRQAAKREFDGLTEREREVAALVALGKSNREIAQELVVSERTAATHVSNILTKLSFSSRAQIAAWATEHGLAKTRLD